MSCICKSKTFHPACSQSCCHPAEGFLKNWDGSPSIASGALVVSADLEWLGQGGNTEMQRWGVIVGIGILLPMLSLVLSRCSTSDLGIFFSLCRVQWVSLVTLVLLESLAQL